MSRFLALLLVAPLAGGCRVSSADHREATRLEVPDAWSVEGKGDAPVEEILKGLIAVKAIPKQFRDGSSLEEIFLALTGESSD